MTCTRFHVLYHLKWSNNFASDITDYVSVLHFELIRWRGGAVRRASDLRFIAGFLQLPAGLPGLFQTFRLSFSNSLLP